MAEHLLWNAAQSRSGDGWCVFWPPTRNSSANNRDDANAHSAARQPAWLEWTGDQSRRYGKELYEWNVIRALAEPEFIGCVEAPDEMAAIQVAIEQFRTSEGAGSRLRWTKMPIAR